jgi:hypothetical protein
LDGVLGRAACACREGQLCGRRPSTFFGASSADLTLARAGAIGGKAGALTAVKRRAS